MAAVVGIMTADYYLITRGNMFIRHLYDGDARNPHYHYFYGFNVQGKQLAFHFLHGQANRSLKLSLPTSLALHFPSLASSVH